MRSVLLSLISFVIISCANDGSTELPPPAAQPESYGTSAPAPGVRPPTPYTETSCYRLASSAEGSQESLLRVTVVGDSVRGTLAYELTGVGTIEGTFRGLKRGDEAQVQYDYLRQDEAGSSPLRMLLKDNTAMVTAPSVRPGPPLRFSQIDCDDLAGE